MCFANLYDLLVQALPRDISRDEMEKALAEYLRDSTSYGVNSLASALRQWPRLNWQAYLANYPDVKNARREGAQHFVNCGIYEGRKLFSRNKFYKPGPADAPKISVIITSFNNIAFLENCIASVTGQTLKDIEIIIVDDASTDGSAATIHKLAAADSRIKAILLDRNQSAHMVRKTGVAIASGNYIMFLDSDDSYNPDACETAWNNIVKGYDIVSFNVNVINNSSLTTKEFNDRTFIYNYLQPGVYEGRDLINMAYNQRIIPHFMWNKIFERNLLQYSFKKLSDAYLNIYEDMYALLAVFHNARNMLKIDSKLVNYNFGSGITTTRNIKILTGDIYAQTAILPHVADLCSRLNLHEQFYEFKRCIATWSFENISLLPASKSALYVEGLVERFGILYTATSLMRCFFDNRKEITRILPWVNADIVSPGTCIERIGIMAGGKISVARQALIKDIYSVLAQKGFKVRLFLDSEGGHIPGITSRHLNITADGPEEIECAMSQLWQSVNQSKIDVMIFLNALEPTLLWHALLLKLSGIRCIAFYPYNFNYEIISKGRSYLHTSLLACLRCLDKVICIDNYSKIYFRAQGVDADSLHEISNIETTQKRYNNKYILAIYPEESSLANFKDCLEVLAEVLKLQPDARMLVLMSLQNREEKQRIQSLIWTTGMQSYVDMEIHSIRLEQYLPDAAVLFTTDMLPGISLNLALAAGLPVVLYKQRAVKSRGRVSVFVDGQLKEAATAIASYLDQKVVLPSSEKVCYNLHYLDVFPDILLNIGAQSRLDRFRREDFQHVLRSISDYAALSKGR